MFASMVTSLNLTRFKTGNWAPFLLDQADAMNGCHRNTVERVTDSWMFNKDLFQRSDLVVFALEAPATMLLASDFSTRPLGKPLPRIEKVCQCAVFSADKAVQAWVVEHNAQHECAVRDVVVSARCSLCGKTWLLNSAYLGGDIYASNERYCVKLVCGE
jgi:hypothetical protein